MLSIGARAKIGFVIATVLVIAAALQTDPVSVSGFTTSEALSAEVSDSEASGGDASEGRAAGSDETDEDVDDAQPELDETDDEEEVDDSDSEDDSDDSDEDDSEDEDSDSDDDSDDNDDQLDEEIPDRLAFADSDDDDEDSDEDDSNSSSGDDDDSEESSSSASPSSSSASSTTPSSSSSNSGSSTVSSSNSGTSSTTGTSTASTSGSSSKDKPATSASHDDDNSDGHHDENEPSSHNDGNSSSSSGALTPISTNSAPANYQENLALIRSQSVRNRLLDNSPFANTPQSQLPIGDNSPLLARSRFDYISSALGNFDGHFPIAAGGQFRVSCEFSHFAYDDPLVFPNQPGAAHLHMFFGNTDVNAFSTADTLNDSGSSTCNGAELNRTGYWAPALIDGDGNARIPERAVIYYKGEGLANGERGDGATGSSVYQRGHANISPAPLTVPEVSSSAGGQIGEVNYKCSNNFSAPPFATGVNEIPNCSGDHFQDTFGAPYPATRTVLEVEVKFWNCLDTTRSLYDFRSWVPAGQGNGGWFFSNCDGSGGGPSNPHLQTFPNLSYFINYVVEPGEDTSDWYLSSDVDPASIGSGGSFSGQRGSTLHADWWGGWHPEINREWIDNCVNFRDPSGTPTGCGTGYLSNAGPDNQNPTPGRALIQRDDFDTVGNSSSYKTPIQTIFNELCAPLNPGRFYTNALEATYCLVGGGHSHN